jgi:calcineurin-like phosphoesterase family protein
MKTYERRDILRLFGVSGVTFASGLWGCAAPNAAGSGAMAPGAPGSGSAAEPMAAGPAPAQDFFFLQLSDTHWGFSGPPNPEADQTLRSTVRTINSVATRPDFLIFTGDLTHTTDDPAVRRARMKEFKGIVSELAVKDVRFIPGEHDASLDGGEAFREFFGETHYTFAHKGISFIALDNVSDPGAILGDAQLAWLDQQVAAAPKNAPLVVFAHRPLFDLFPAWDWATKDGPKAIEILEKHPNVTVFYGHIHQEHHQTTGRIAHHAARSLVFPLPAPGSVPKKAPLPWDAQSPDHGLGYREVTSQSSALKIAEHPFGRG